MPVAYILYSSVLDQFYIGSTVLTVQERLEQHNHQYYDNKFTSRTSDWEIFLTIDCITATQARLVEAHIKRMKSRAYVKNLRQYPEMVEKLLRRYEVS
jgi:putative endonuclease